MGKYSMEMEQEGFYLVSAIGFKKWEPTVPEIFPDAVKKAADPPVYIKKNDKAAALLEYHERFLVVGDEEGVSILAYPLDDGEHRQISIDAVSHDREEAKKMMEEIAKECGFIKTDQAPYIGEELNQLKMRMAIKGLAAELAAQG